VFNDGTMGEGGEGGNDSGCGSGSKEDMHSVWGLTDGRTGEGGGDSHISASVERRGDDSKAGLGSEIASATPPSGLT